MLLQLEDWLEDKQDQRVFWLNGLAGTGKPTIAQTFVEVTFAEGKLGASFFFSRNFKDRSNIRAILPALAFQPTSAPSVSRAVTPSLEGVMLSFDLLIPSTTLRVALQIPPRKATTRTSDNRLASLVRST